MVNAGIPGGPGTWLELPVLPWGTFRTPHLCSYIDSGRYSPPQTARFQLLSHCWACSEHLQPLPVRSPCPGRWLPRRTWHDSRFALSPREPHQVSGKTSLTERKSPLTQVTWTLETGTSSLCFLTHSKALWTTSCKAPLAELGVSG